jgi:hypothetical protein
VRDQKTPPLTPVGVEQLREIRSRLNRVPKGALGDKSVAPLSRGFFDICARVDLPSDGEAAAVAVKSVSEVLEADFAGLRRLVCALRLLQPANPAAYRSLFDAGVLQAIATRRLVLDGRERSSEDPS